MKSELTALDLRRHQLAEENCINECSEVDLSQMGGNKAVRYFHALLIYLPTMGGVFRVGKHTELPQK